MAQQEQGKLVDTLSCDEKNRLIIELIAANHELLELQNQQMRAVISQDADFLRFDDLIHLARERKEQAKYTLIAHLEGHHC